LTEYVFIKGKLSWAKTQVPDEWGKWKVTVHPDAESLEKIRDLQGQGIKNVLKKNDEGYYTTFSRPVSKMIKGKVVGLAPPEVLEADGKTPLKNALIGNGSDGIIKLEVYTHGTPGGGKAKAARLMSICVKNLIPFEMNRDFSEGQKEAVKGLEEQEMFF
jgi:hypothetical protein